MEKRHVRGAANVARSLTKGLRTVNLYGGFSRRVLRERVMRSGELGFSGFAGARQFGNKCEKPRRRFFLHVLKPSCGAAGRDAFKDGPAANRDLPEAITVYGA